MAEITTSQSSTSPPSSVAARRSPRGAIDATFVPVRTWMPLRSHHVLIIAPAPSVIIRGTMRLPVSTIVSRTPLAASASMMMQPMNPAPICTTSAPGFATARILRASSSVQHASTFGRSMPGIGGRFGVTPVAISSRS